MMSTRNVLAASLSKVTNGTTVFAALSRGLRFGLQYLHPLDDGAVVMRV